MEEFAKYLNIVLILAAVFMGFKQGLAMVSGKPEMIELFAKWNFNKTTVQMLGVVTVLSAILIVFPKTFVWGNYLMAATILMILCFQLYDKNLKGAALELPFLLLNLLIIYFQYPIKKWL